MKLRIITIFFTLLILAACTGQGQLNNLQRAQQTMDSIYLYYSDPQSLLLHENYPDDAGYSATYLASEDTGSTKRFAYLWPFSGTFSAANAMLHASKDDKYLEIIENRILPALNAYYDDSRFPPCYASYIRESGLSDRFYDDNIWIAIDFTDLYQYTQKQVYIDKAKEIWNFILSGKDDLLGSGIYWCEQKKQSKNTCSNAPAAVLAFKIFEATGDSSFFYSGLELYNWTKKNLQDTADKLYFDNIHLNGHIDKRKYPYNSGQMLQAASYLYRITGNKEYLTEAQQIASSAIRYFTETGVNESFPVLKKGNVWFNAIMFRGFIELYKLDQDKQYIDIWNKNLQYSWNNNRDRQGFFSPDWSGKSPAKNKWLLDQAAMAEMYANISAVISN